MLWKDKEEIMHITQGKKTIWRDYPPLLFQQYGILEKSEQWRWKKTRSYWRFALATDKISV